MGYHFEDNFVPRQAAPVIPAGQPHHPGFPDPHRAGVDGREVP